MHLVIEFCFNSNHPSLGLSTTSAEAEATKEQIDNDIDTFEKQLLEKYKPAPSADSLGSPQADSDSLSQVLAAPCPSKDSSYVLTRSLYAEQKQLNLDSQVSEQDSLEKPSVVEKQQQQQQQQRGAITALSINEIETRKSLVIEADTSDDQSSTQDEKSVKEEFVLIGEKNDIDSLLDNKNNQLYNLIMSNSNRANKLDEIETNLNKVSWLCVKLI